MTLSFSFDGLDAENIKVNIIHPYNVFCEDSNFTISSLSNFNSPFKKQVHFRLISSLFLTNTTVKVDVTYIIKSK